MSKILLIILWVMTVLLVLFSAISFAGVVMRIPALISLCIAILLSVFRKRSRSWVWVTGCVLGILVSLSAIYPLATTHGSSVTSSDSLGSGYKIQTSEEEPPIKPSEVASILNKSEAQFGATSGIVTTASAFDGKENIKFRVMVHGTPSKRKATKLFDDILTNIGLTWQPWRCYKHG